MVLARGLLVWEVFLVALLSNLFTFQVPVYFLVAFSGHICWFQVPIKPGLDVQLVSGPFKPGSA